MSREISEAEYEAILEKRAEALAQAPTERAERKLSCTVALVGVGGEIFGVPVSGMQEVVRAPALTPLPGLPPWLPGIVQIRGEVLSAVSLAKWLGIERGGEEGYLVVLAGFEVSVGLLVDSVLGFRDVYEDELAGGLGEGERGRRPVSQTTRDLVSILDLAALVRSPDLRLATRGSPSGGQRPADAD
jgi:purine-binding chemotaxis protein CheW